MLITLAMHGIKKIKQIAFFLMGIVMVFTLILTRQYFKTSQANGSTANNMIVYDDQLATGFSNWSWGSSVNFSNTSPVFSGSDSISFTPSVWGGLYLHSATVIDPTHYVSLQFAMQTTDSPNNFTLLFYGNTNQIIKSLPLSQYMENNQNRWLVYSIPLSSIASPITGFAIQETSGHAGPAVYFDIMQFVTNQSTQQNASSQSNSKPTITSTPTVLIKPTAIPTIAPVTPTPTKAVSGNPFSGITFFNDISNDPATQQSQQWQSSDPSDATTIAKIASQPKALWIGDWTSNVQSSVQSEMTKAQKANALPVFVAYNIPQRDCGSYSSGGATSSQVYKSWIDNFASGIGSGKAAIILEPDALAQISCLSSSDQQQRIILLSYAVQKFKSLGQTAVYIDAGNANWIDATTMAGLLKSADVAQADGFALNVSNFYTDGASVNYGQQVSAQIQNKHFVIDTSRNGNGPTSDNQWCNPPGRALGDKPTTQTGNPLVDAYLWIKYPGESDGTCNGAPAAGVWDPSYALGLAQNAKW